jgi:hypothetical protein
MEAEGGAVAVVDLKEQRGERLVQAVRAGDAAMVGALVRQEGVEQFIDHRDSHGMTALCWAACEGHTAIARLLLEQGADLGAKNYERQTARRMAREHGNGDTAVLLLHAALDRLVPATGPRPWAERLGEEEPGQGRGRRE